MAFFGLRAYPTPIVKPLWPFMAASVVVFYGVWNMQSAMLKSPEFAHDVRNPNAKPSKAAH